MLVLSRHRDESIMIGDDVEIIIVDIRGGKVRLGITAPADIPVHRKEVYERIKAQYGEQPQPHTLRGKRQDTSKASPSETK